MFNKNNFYLKASHDLLKNNYIFIFKMQNALQASATESILKQVFKGTQGTVRKFPIEFIYLLLNFFYKK